MWRWLLANGGWNAIVSALLMAIGYGVRQIYTMVDGHLRRIDTMDQRVEDTAVVVDEHTDILVAAGWVGDRRLPRVSKQRRRTDREASL